MPSCAICGSERATYRERSRMYLCPSCHRGTPRKVNRDTFEQVYWDGQADTVPHGIRQAFWEDYLTSQYGPVADYSTATTETVLW